MNIVTDCVWSGPTERSNFKRSIIMNEIDDFMTSAGPKMNEIGSHLQFTIIGICKADFIFGQISNHIAMVSQIIHI